MVKAAMRLMRRGWGIALACLFAVVALYPNVALANSARMHWEGVASPGVIAVDAECPLVVEHELLTFDVVDVPQEYYTEDEDPLSYASTVTAAYQFHNPAEYAVSATLAFPFGALPDYLQDSLFEVESAEYAQLVSGRTGVWVDGESAQVQLRHTYFYPYGYFDLERDVALLVDGYVDDPFYAPDLPVTKFTYEVSGIPDGNDAATIGFRWTPQDDAKIRLVNQSGLHRLDDGEDSVIVDTWVENGQVVEVYVFGAAPEGILAGLFADGSCTTGLDGRITNIGVEVLTFKEFALMGWDESSAVLEHDWYNAVVALLNQCDVGTDGVIMDAEWRYTDSGAIDLTGMLLRWYQYDIALEPGQRLENSVTAPLYPSINLESEPPVYGYSYLLSPASTWADFGELEVLVNTELFMVESNLDGFARMEDGAGYGLSLDGLLDGELEFTLSASENPREPVFGSKTTYLLALVAPAVALLAVIGLVAGLAAAALTRRRRR